MTKKRDSTMKRIIASAEVLFYSQGVNQTTQQDIANLADVNRGLIHYHFGSKQAIALHISRRFTRELNRITAELFFKDEEDIVFRSIAQGRILFNTLFSNRNFERFFMEEMHGRILSESEEDSPVYRDFCRECAYLGLDLSPEEMLLYSAAISSVEHKLFAAKTTGMSTLSAEEIVTIYNRIHLSILGYSPEAQQQLIDRAIALSRRIRFVNNGNFDVKPEYFTYTP